MDSWRTRADRAIFRSMDGSDRLNEEGRGPKPTPIREVVGETRPSPSRPTGESQAGASPEQRERPKGPRDAGRPRGGGDRGKGSSAPRPARDAGDGRCSEPTAVEDLPSCEFVIEGIKWIARLCGRTSTGSTADPGAPLLHLTFYEADDPLVAVREALLPGDSIDHLFEADLEVVLASASKAKLVEQASEAPPKPGPPESRR